ncbi:MAG: HpcH/HpaI aldolase/citrate lyase family protein [Parvibaculaceae bacterium]
MRENKVRKIWAEGGTVINGWLAIPSSISAELMAKQGWDSICIDMQHGAIDYTDALPMLQAISTTDTTPLIRIPWFDPAIIGKSLDAGAYGIICPMVNSRKEAEAFVAACRYAPLGMRSVGPLRASLYAGADYVKHANSTILAIAMIESAEALKNVEEVLTTPGLDGIYVGPSDLAVSMGESAGFDPRFPKVFEAIRHVAAMARKHGIPAGIHVGSVKYGLEMVEAGYRFVSYLSDFRMLQTIAAKSLAALRAGAPDPSVP